MLMHRTQTPQPGFGSVTLKNSPPISKSWIRDNLWHKLCNFLSKHLVSIYFSRSTLLTSFPAVMGGFKVLGGRGEEIGYGENLAMITSYAVDLWNVSERQTLTLQITG